MHWHHDFERLRAENASLRAALAVSRNLLAEEADTQQTSYELIDALLTMIPVSVTEITIRDQGETQVDIQLHDDTHHAEYTYHLSDGTDTTTPPAGVTPNPFASTSDAVDTVDPTSGAITTVAEGTDQITGGAVLPDGSTLEAVPLDVTVTAPPEPTVVGITIVGV